MVIQLEDIGKRYGREWIFKHVSFQFVQGEAYAVTGPNGSGKSTLLKIISGGMTPTKGKVGFKQDGKRNLNWDESAGLASFAAPYIQLIDELSLSEMIAFHQKFVPMNGMSVKDVMDKCMLEEHADKPIKQFSSGMMQRLKLSLSIFSETPILLLDEPTSNLDEQTIAWYHEIMTAYTSDRLVVIGSNQPAEYSFTKARLHVPDFKP